jgi:tRNA threonylcarbamoyladenosine biosynthesis protein TsaE
LIPLLALSEVCETLSADETVELGRRLARRLKPGDTVAFFGDLGAGKTTMIKGVAQELGVKETVRSPSFVVVTEYQGQVRVQHVDLYRLQGAAELAGVGFADLFRPDAITLIEWADRAGLELPGNAVRVEMKVKEADRRSIRIRFSETMDEHR